MLDNFCLTAAASGRFDSRRFHARYSKIKTQQQKLSSFGYTNAKLKVKARLKPVYWENQKQCAAALGLDVRELRECKAENCPAFRFSRIYHAELLEWIKKRKNNACRKSKRPPQNDELPKSHWDREKARADYERAAFNLEVEK